MILNFRRLDGHEINIKSDSVRRWDIVAYDPRYGLVTASMDIDPERSDSDKLREACYVVGDEVERLGAESHEWGTVAEEV